MHTFSPHEVDAIFAKHAGKSLKLPPTCQICHTLLQPWERKDKLCTVCKRNNSVGWSLWYLLWEYVMVGAILLVAFGIAAKWMGEVIGPYSVVVWLFATFVLGTYWKVINKATKRP